MHTIECSRGCDQDIISDYDLKLTPSHVTMQRVYEKNHQNCTLGRIGWDVYYGRRRQTYGATFAS